MTVIQRSRKGDKTTGGTEEPPTSRPSTARPKTATPFSGRYNPKYENDKHEKRLKVINALWFVRLMKRISPETSDKGAVLSHKQWTRIVTIGAIAMILYYTAKSGKTNTIMAKQSEVLESKRYQNSVCTPSYRQDIEKVGSQGKERRKDEINAWISYSRDAILFEL